MSRHHLFNPDHMAPAAGFSYGAVAAEGRTLHIAGLTGHGRDLSIDEGIVDQFSAHEVLKPRLQALVDYLEAEVGEAVPNRWYTDTGPILEREMGQRAGLGWFGKNPGGGETLGAEPADPGSANEGRE